MGRQCASLTLMFLLSSCGGTTAVVEETTPEPVTEAITTEPEVDDGREAAQEAAQAFAAALGPILVASPSVQRFVACDRVNALLAGAIALRDAGVPDGVVSPAVYQEELARLPAATTMMATYCGRGEDTVPADFWVSSELIFYRLLSLLEADSTLESGQVTAASALRELLAPVFAAHREDRVSALCEIAEPLVEAAEELESAGTPAGFSSSTHYPQELTRLLTLSRTATTECAAGVGDVSASLPISVEVSSHRIWLMLHDRWPGTVAE